MKRNTQSANNPCRDRNRRRRWLDKVEASNVSRGCKAWLLALARCSDDYGKGVWGRQTKQAERLGCCERTIRTYRREAEEAKLIHTIRTPYDPTLGRRAKVNYYQLLIPKARRRCLPSRKTSQGHNFVTGNPLPVEQHPTGVDRTLGINELMDRPPVPRYQRLSDEDRVIEPLSKEARNYLASMKALLV